MAGPSQLSKIAAASDPLAEWANASGTWHAEDSPRCLAISRAQFLAATADISMADAAFSQALFRYRPGASLNGWKRSGGLKRGYASQSLHPSTMDQ